MFYRFLSSPTNNEYTNQTPQSNTNKIDWKLYLPIIIAVAAVYIIVAIIVCFWKVPLKRGYRCRCGERTKWFIKALVYEIFFIFVLLHWAIKGIFKLLDCFCPDTKTEDNKLPEDRQKFVEFKEETKGNKQ